jgi:hypothetical protein
MSSKPEPPAAAISKPETKCVCAMYRAVPKVVKRVKKFTLIL